MTEAQQVETAREFALEWNGRGDEDRDYLIFWTTMLRDVFGVDKPEKIFAPPQYPVHFKQSTKKIDLYAPRTKVLIEQKGLGVDLNKIYRQSDGEYLTPFGQAKRYADALPASERPRWIITCNFVEFHIYDLQQMDSLEYLTGVKTYAPTVIKLENFRYDYARLKFIIDPDAAIKPEIKISTDAAKIVRKICAAIDKNYTERDDDYINALSKLCARLVFCFYADDAKLFNKVKFADYLKNFSAAQLKDALQNFFDALNLPENERDNFDDILKNFPRVNGGLFDEKIPIPPLNKDFQHEVTYAHIFKTDAGNFRLDELGRFITFSWREIEPPIFGAMFEAIFNPDTRRADGIHYTSVENIHKVIDPLFFDDLSAELAKIKSMHKKNRVAALRNFQDKLASLNFLDPACGSGNFLTEIYICLRRLENEVLAELRSLNVDIPDNPVKVSPSQFYGIEINDFAVAVAKDALWIAEIQMLRKTSWILGRELKELPLKKYETIIHANALRVDWNFFEVNRSLGYQVNREDSNNLTTNNLITYIIGNPPFVGARMKSAAQAADIKNVFSGWSNTGNLDYVTCWYKKAADFMEGNNVRAAFVSTNSVCQGDSVGLLWKKLFAAGVHIDFAYRTFKWLSESDNPAQVHCVVVGFSTAPNDKPKLIFDGNEKIIAQNINAYLGDDEDIFVESRNAPIQDGVPEMQFANQPLDDKKYRFTPEEMEDFIKQEPAARKYFRPWYGAKEFIQGKRRYCLWLGDTPLEEIKKMPLCWERVEAVRNYRLKSTRPATKRLAATPTRFQVENFPSGNYLAIPQTSSENRKYIPINFVDNSNVASEKLLIVPSAQVYHFGILTSSIHMAWMRATCGRLENRYSYSIKIVYNNFPWCSPSERQRRRIEETAQEILTIRAGFADWTFARLYNEDTMPADLRDAHKENDYAVALAYRFEEFFNDEARVVAELMRLYKKISGS